MRSDKAEALSLTDEKWVEKSAETIIHGRPLRSEIRIPPVGLYRSQEPRLNTSKAEGVSDEASARGFRVSQKGRFCNCAAGRPTNGRVSVLTNVN
jgi:hypothetical protein